MKYEKGAVTKSGGAFFDHALLKGSDAEGEYIMDLLHKELN